jgi:heat shock protein HtpX
MGNQLKTTMLLAVLTAFLIWVGQILGGRQGMLFALVLAAGMNFISYWYSDKIVLAMYRGRPVSHAEAPELHEIVAGLTERAGLPMPRIYVLPEQAPNAFATGRNPEHAVVAVTEGLLKIMNRDEIAGVLGHELAHVNNRDILIGSIAATLAGAVMMLAHMARWAAIFGGIGGRGSDREEGGGVLGLLFMSILAPIAAMLIQTAISRSREYQADAIGSRFAGGPEGLASALQKIGAYSGRIPLNAGRAAAQATAHMFIANPLSSGGLWSLFSTHPPIEDRISRLLGHGPRGDLRQEDTTGRGRAEAQALWKRLS